MTTAPQAKIALLRVDMINCFFPLDPKVLGTGELPVDSAPGIIAVVNELSASPKFDVVVDIVDDHPFDHGSFASQHEGKNPGDMIDLFGVLQRLWTDHGRNKTPGAAFHPELDRSRCDHITYKGRDKKYDSYSGFKDNNKSQKTDLADWLRSQGVTKVVVTGITRPFCASYTAKDAVDEGFETYLVIDACSMLDPSMTAADAADLTAHGVKLVESSEFL